MTGLGSQEFAAEWEDGSPAEPYAWYYARIIQMDGQMAWSSPVFVTRTQGAGG